MKVFVLLLLIGASLAVMADHGEDLDDFSDDDLVTIAEREPEPEDEQETGVKNEPNMEDDDLDDLSDDLHQMCNVTDSKKPSFAHVDEDDDDSDAKSGFEVHMKHRHHPRGRHHKKHHRHVKHWKHKKHGKRGVSISLNSFYLQNMTNLLTIGRAWLAQLERSLPSDHKVPSSIPDSAKI